MQLLLYLFLFSLNFIDIVHFNIYNLFKIQICGILYLNKINIENKLTNYWIKIIVWSLVLFVLYKLKFLVSYWFGCWVLIDIFNILNLLYILKIDKKTINIIKDFLLILILFSNVLGIFKVNEYSKFTILLTSKYIYHYYKFDIWYLNLLININILVEFDLIYLFVYLILLITSTNVSIVNTILISVIFYNYYYFQVWVLLLVGFIEYNKVFIYRHTKKITVIFKISCFQIPNFPEQILEIYPYVFILKNKFK